MDYGNLGMQVWKALRGSASFEFQGKVVATRLNARAAVRNSELKGHAPPV